MGKFDWIPVSNPRDKNTIRVVGYTFRQIYIDIRNQLLNFS